MKRILSLMLALALLGSLVGCSVEENNKPDGEETTTTTAAESTTTTTTTAATQPTETEEATTTTTAAPTEPSETQGTTVPTESTTTTTANRPTTGGGKPIGISTMKGSSTTTTFKKYTTTTTTTTAATTTTTRAPKVATPVMDKPYECWIAAGTDLIVASATFTDAGCIIARKFYTCDPEHKVYGTNVETAEYGGKTYYKTTSAPQAAARYEIDGIYIHVYNADGSVAKTFALSDDSTTLGCSYSDGVAFGRNNTFTLVKD